MYVALLRGINVGGKNRLPMATLQTIFADAGCRAIQTYIQSGNVVFDAPRAKVARLATTLEAAITKVTKLTVPVVLLTADELVTIARDNPHVADGIASEQLHIALLATTPTASAIATLDPHRSLPDAFVVRGRAIYLHLPNGVARTKLTNSYFDRALGTVATVRNHRTLDALVALATPSKTR